MHVAQQKDRILQEIECPAYQDNLAEVHKRMIDKYDILAVIAPIAAPAAPATMLISILYTELMRETVSQSFAMGAAVASGIGAEASGMIAAYVGVQAYRKRKFGLMTVAIFAFCAYAAFMALGISAARNPVAMVSTIIISVIAYIAVAMLTDLRSILTDAQAEANTKISLLEAQKRLTNAETRKAKINGFVHANNTQTQPAITRLSAAKIAEIQQYWNTHPGAKYRDVSKAVGCAPSTAMKYKP